MTGRIFHSLAGLWGFGLDPVREGLHNAGGFFNANYPYTITLPGDTFTNKIGIENRIDDSGRIATQNLYYGRAWYQREIDIPLEWEDCRVEFVMECAPRSTLWLDGILVGNNNNLYSPQSYDLTNLAYPGRHKLAMLLDNSITRPDQYGRQGRHFEINGVLGELSLLITDRVWIKDVRILPQPSLKSALFTVTVGNVSGCDAEGVLTIDTYVPDKHAIHKLQVPFLVEHNRNFKEIVLQVPFGNDFLLWDEFEPNLYQVTVSLQAHAGNRRCTDTYSTRFGMREFSIKGKQFTVNGKTIMLRGDGWMFFDRLSRRLGLNITDVELWRRIMKITREWGMNHIRFHTQCPPKAAFDMADEYGVYLQAELTLGRPTRIPREGENEFEPLLEPTLKEHGAKLLWYHYNHPSFMLLTMGNEIDADEGFLGRLVSYMKNIDPSRFYSGGSNNYLRHAHMTPGDEFWCTQKTGDGWDEWKIRVRGSSAHADAPLGSIQTDLPNSLRDYSEAIEHIPIPVVGFEVGQYETTPNYDEIQQFSPGEIPYNLIAFRDIMCKHGLSYMEKTFYRNSGKLCGLCYREDIEMYLRTPDIAGFHLLSLADTHVSGTSLTGVLNLFLENKGFIEPSEWKRFCDSRVVLLRTDRFTYADGETLFGTLQLANYGEGAVLGAIPYWILLQDGRVIAQECLGAVDIPQGGLYTIGKVTIPLRSKEPIALTIEVGIKGGPSNEYLLWIYPNVPLPALRDNIEVTDNWKSAVAALMKGANVLFFPGDLPGDKAVNGEFATNFWSYTMFQRIAMTRGTAVPSGTMGISCDPTHPALRYFPNKGYSEWQWFPIVTNGTAAVLDKLGQSLDPIVWIIDNPMRGSRLGLIFEARVSSGKLLVCMSHLCETLEQLPSRWLYISLLEYITSEEFKPVTQIDMNELNSFFG
jgi:hypothetical protein